MAAAAPAATFLRCQACGIVLNASKGDNRETGRCATHLDTPVSTRPAAPSTTHRTGATGGPPPFTAADVSLIGSISSHLPATAVLKLLNDRLVADRGPGVPLHTLEQLQQQTAKSRSVNADGGWSAQRRILAAARTSGALQRITPQVIDDFAIVFRLSPAQVTHLRDVVASATED